MLQSELKVSPTPWGVEGGVQLGSQESDMCSLQNLRYLAPWEMPALGKIAGSGGKSPAQERSHVVDKAHGWDSCLGAG